MAKAAAPAGKKPKAPSKSEVMASIAEATGLSKKEIAGVFDALQNEIKKALSNKGPGVFQVPGLLKIVKRKVPAKPARKNVPDPFNKGQFRDYPAKPASTKVKVLALKQLKGFV